MSFQERNSCRFVERRPLTRLGTTVGWTVLLWAALITGIRAAPPAQEPETIHVVQAGETLFGIAQRYGTTVDIVVAVNGLDDPNHIFAGQRLLVPAPGMQMTQYVVQPGDTLAIIARRYSLASDEVARLNRLANPNLIYVGQRLLMPVTSVDASPDGRAEAVKAATVVQPKVYVVQPRDTLARIAARYGVSVWALAQANQIANPSVVHVGQRLLIPVTVSDGAQASSSYLPAPFLAVKVVPAIAVQGQTVQLVVETDGEVDLNGQYDGHSLFFIESTADEKDVEERSSVYRTLIAIPAMAPPGPYVLEIGAVQEEVEVSIHSMLYVTAGSFGVQYISLSADKARLLDPELVAQETRRLQEVTIKPTLPGLWEGQFTVPLNGTAGISAPFGGRRSYNGGPVVSYHEGVDYSVGAGTPVLCPASGKVVLAEALLVRGNAVVVDHGRGVMSGYWHLAQIDVVEGQTVEPGQVLGRVGSTGLSTGAHLHWEMRVMGIPVDPLQWVSQEIR
jgi:murein DD-endopeptidase MepM/ murein hydrolase activator NlpD